MRARREDKADVLISKLSGRDKQEIVLSLEHLHEAGGGWRQGGEDIKMSPFLNVE